VYLFVSRGWVALKIICRGTGVLEIFGIKNHPCAPYESGKNYRFSKPYLIPDV
jgi:hypothetical protein